MTTSDKPINYFAVAVTIIKNSKHEITQEFGIKGKETTPNHGFNSLKQRIKEDRNKNYPKDKHEIVITHFDEISKEVYEQKFGKILE